MNNIQLFSNQTGTYNVSVLWEIAPKATWLPLSIFKGSSEHLWGKSHPTPDQLLQSQRGHHWDIAMQADLRYAIIATPTLWVADGNHRLLKAKFLGKTHIKARIFSSYKEMRPALQ